MMESPIREVRATITKYAARRFRFGADYARSHLHDDCLATAQTDFYVAHGSSPRESA